MEDGGLEEVEDLGGGDGRVVEESKVEETPTCVAVGEHLIVDEDSCSVEGCMTIDKMGEGWGCQSGGGGKQRNCTDACKFLLP